MSDYFLSFVCVCMSSNKVHVHETDFQGHISHSRQICSSQSLQPNATFLVFLVHSQQEDQV